MKAHTLKLTSLFSIAVISIAAAAADVDYPQLRKDVSVMEKILLTEFERGEGIRIKGNYLARQGAVFNITAPRGINVFVDGDEESSFMFRTGDDGDFEYSFIDLNTIVIDALDSVRIGPAMESEMRAMARELARDSRELEREIARLRIEKVHVIDEEKVEIEKDLERIETEMEELAERRETVKREMEEKAREVEERARVLREEREQERLEQIANIETKLLRSLCDYGSTLSNLPNNEHVTLIVSGISKDEEKIYVFERNQVTNCKTGSDKLAQNALQYMF